MSKNFYFQIILLSLAVSASFCVVGCSNKSRQTAVENERKNIIKAELTSNRQSNISLPNIQSVELFAFEAQPIYLSGKSFTESPKNNSDNSQINTMFDGFGNKTEMRCLNNDPILKCIRLKTSAAGYKQATVFGKHGEIKTLPDEMSDRAMTADASFVASAAGIYKLSAEPSASLETDGNKIAESFNNPVPTLLSTSETPVYEQDTPTDQATETASTKLPDTKKDSSPDNKFDRFRLNNYSLKKNPIDSK